MKTFTQRISEAWQQHRKKVLEIKSDPSLSAEGKRQVLDQLNSQTLATYNQIRQEAESVVIAAEGKVVAHKANLPKGKSYTTEEMLTEQRQVELLLGRLMTKRSDAHGFMNAVTEIAASNPEVLTVAYARIHDMADRLFPADKYAAERGSLFPHLEIAYKNAAESLVTPAEKTHHTKLTELESAQSAAFGEFMAVDRSVRQFEETLGTAWEDVVASL